MITIDQNEDGARLDRVIARLCSNVSKVLIQKLIRQGNVRVNRKRVKFNRRVVEGDQVFLPQVLRAEDESTLYEERPRHKPGWPIQTIFEDDEIWLLNKPEGVPVHGGSGHAWGYLEFLRETTGLEALQLVHRLDRDTSGCLLITKQLKILRGLMQQFANREIQKVYLALVVGHIRKREGVMRSHLRKGLVRGGERMVASVDEGQEAVTRFKRVYAGEIRGVPCSCVALYPETGRTHQLRVHMSEMGFSILGDRKYGNSEQKELFRKTGWKGMALHAYSLQFTHPELKKAMKFISDVPKSWSEFLPEGFEIEA